MTACALDSWLPAPLRESYPDPHVVIAMSGGVDSSVAAMLVRESGLRCSALFMKNWNEPEDDGSCRWEDDVADALAVCERLDIPINTLDLSDAYWDGVFTDFLEQYRRGRTPNPDVLCNREIKFKSFLDAARSHGGDIIATGHYAQSASLNGCMQLLKGADANKDQSYFLYTLGQTQLGGSVFPVGGLPKTEVRALARTAGLATHEKKDSTGICFIGERRFREFLGRFIPARPGAIVTDGGRAIGAHQGVAFYTLGQRQGLGIGGVSGAEEAPWFVIGKDLASNELIVAQDHDHPALMNDRLWATELSWVSALPPTAPLRCMAKTRYRQREQRCTVELVEADEARVVFEQPQRAITPGQSIVFYHGEMCLGGGIIDRVRGHQIHPGP